MPVITALASNTPPNYRIRAPRLADAPAVHALIGRCPPLDTNSLYCNLLQCYHHAETCALAESEEGRLRGFVSGYRLPAYPENLFLWQIAIDEQARGRGLAKRLIWTILGRPICRGVRYLRATISADNIPSWAMFQGLADSLQADRKRRVLFDSTEHLADQHASEDELIIGPFTFTSHESKGPQ